MKRARTLVALVMTAALLSTLLPVTVEAADDGYDYIDENGAAQNTGLILVTPLTGSGTGETLTDGNWYIVLGAGVTRSSTVTVVGHAYLILADGADLTVTGSVDNAGIDISAGNSLTIYGQAAGTGALTATGHTYCPGIGGGSGDAGSVTINGGNVTATGGASGAGIGGRYSCDSGSVTVNGGVVNATGGGSGAGIGSGESGTCGSITISGGTVTATGGEYAAGIGGSVGNAGGNVTISGGTVTATGGELAAGIGGGTDGNCDSVTISGGTVTATGGDGGAGIGSGAGGNCDSVTISGGTVHATGGEYAAGIGGGYWSVGGNVTISGGTVHATGGEYAAGIGGGLVSAGGNVTISSGTVFAEGGNEGRDIGGSGGMLNISGDAAVFLRRDSFISPAAPLAHTHETITGHMAGGSVYGIPVDWSGDFGAFLLLHTLSYDANGGTGTVAASVTTGTTVLVQSGSSLSRVDYAFVGWNTQEDGSGTDYVPGDTFTFSADATLYAQWQALFVAVTNITDVPSAATAGVNLTLTGTVIPANATNQAIVWSVQSAGTTGATISGNTLFTTAAGTVIVTATITNGLTASTDYTQALSIVISSAPPAGTAPTITTSSPLPNGRVGSSYSRILAATGDTPIIWSMEVGSLPGGLTLSSGGVISGTPTARGTFDFTVKAENSEGDDTKALRIVINTASTGRSSSGGTTVIIQPEKKPGQPVIAEFSAAPTVNQNGHATVTISQQAVADAITKALADAKAQGKTANGIGISLDINLPDTAKSLEIVLSQATLKSLVDAGVKQLEINGVILSLDLDLEALKEIQRQSTGDVTITIRPAQNLSPAARKLIGARPVYDVTISYVTDGKTVNITSLGKGSATLSFPYKPGKNEAVGWLFGVYVDGRGNATRIPGSGHDANRRGVLLGADHFSVYGVGYESPSEKYTDIENHWARESIDYAVGRGLFSGTTDTTFSPDTAMNRGMMVTVLGRLAGVDVSAYKNSSFSDVAAGKYYLPYVEWAYEKGIVQDIGNGQFSPESAITREEIALILTNYAKATGYTLPVTREAVTFADSSSIGDAYKDAVKAMQQAGIMTGEQNNEFNPRASATRAEVATMLHRYVKLTIDPATAQGWAKNDDGQWFYYQDGKPLTGRQTIDGVKYSFFTDATLQTGWVKDGENWYFFSGNKALVGWLNIGSETGRKRYYFDDNAIIASDTWLQIEGKWYYFHPDGTLAVSTKIDGHEVDENGVRKDK